MLSDQELEAFRAKHGRIEHVVYNGVEIVFRKPSRTECKMHAAKMEDPQQKYDADEQLAQVLVLVCGEAKEPTPARLVFNEMLEEYGYMMKSKPIVEALAKLTGVMQSETGKSFGSASKPSEATQTSSRKG